MARRFVLLWSGVALTVGVVLFLTTSWSSRFDPFTRCITSPKTFTEGLPIPLTGPAESYETDATSERFPPRTKCVEHNCGPEGREIPDCRGGATATFYVEPNAGDWAILGGVSAGAGLVVALIGSGLMWLAKRVGLSLPRSNPFIWIDRDDDRRD